MATGIKNISMEEPPYGIIISGLKNGNVVPFLGAGASLLQSNSSAQIPSASALARFLADKARFPSTDISDRADLAKVSSYYVEVSSRKFLRQELRSTFINQTYKCNRLHRLLAQLSDKTTMVTTNYDTLLEEAFNEIGKPYDLVVYPADNSEYANGILWWPYGDPEPKKLKPNEIDVADLERTNVIYKMHGTVWQQSAIWDSFVITEEDYVRFLSRSKHAVPTAFRRHFSDRPFLFLGYGLKDWNLRVLLKEVRVSELRSWAILRGPTALEKMLWDHRKVILYDLDLDVFVDEMEKELRGR
jgi:hypothetical protein